MFNRIVPISFLAKKVSYGVRSLYRRIKSNTVYVNNLLRYFFYSKYENKNYGARRCVMKGLIPALSLSYHRLPLARQVRMVQLCDKTN